MPPEVLSQWRRLYPTWPTKRPRQSEHQHQSRLWSYKRLERIWGNPTEGTRQPGRCHPHTKDLHTPTDSYEFPLRHSIMRWDWGLLDAGCWGFVYFCEGIGSRSADLFFRGLEDAARFDVLSFHVWDKKETNETRLVKGKEPLLATKLKLVTIRLFTFLQWTLS